MGFPDKKYLRQLADNLEKATRPELSDVQRIMMYSGARLQWLGDFFSDTTVTWKKKSWLIDDLTLTGTHPTWNSILLDRCHRSPREVRALFMAKPSIKKHFASARWNSQPILLRLVGKEHKVLDGMHRVIAALRMGKTHIVGYEARANGMPRPMCEPHVVYDLLRAYERGLTTDRNGLESALLYLRDVYDNVDVLLRERFDSAHLRHTELNEIIAKILA